MPVQEPGRVRRLEAALSASDPSAHAAVRAQPPVQAADAVAVHRPGREQGRGHTAGRTCCGPATREGRAADTGPRPHTPSRTHTTHSPPAQGAPSAWRTRTTESLRVWTPLAPRRRS